MTFDPTPREPQGTDPRKGGGWKIVAGVFATLMFTLAAIAALTPSGTQTVTSAPPTPPATQTR